MVELLAQRLLNDNLETDLISLYVGYSRDLMKNVNVSKRLSYFTNLYTKIVYEYKKLYEENVDKKVPIRRIGISFGRIQEVENEQLNLFENIENNLKEKRLEKSIIEIKSKLGKNAILRGMNLEDAATTVIRNKLIGGHNGN